uniref:tRNA(Ile)-lysidine synthase n=1 Tax=Capsosiphon fulvescens TaxID=205396 RepID=A0A3G1RIV5_9CHLO|nr:tRNA(Ile)-lysidine synthetase [Capsosiphon fulvescens]AWX64084.1 tRNA(Ile)-lysidine synthetase [Capsosiphon fulvescens]AYV90001.1 tRNA(Ile)-lysidine synthetase [Capsosiphon fulvescens]
MKKKLDCLKLVNFIEKSKDFQLRILSCRKILIAYSGGQDSTALLTVFYILSKKFSFNIGVVYCNHRWTNSNSGPIAAFEFVSHLSLPFYFVDAQKAIQPEEVARLWRYSSFKNIYLAYGYDLILTGHTLSDCAETVILNLCRGSGLRGVCSLKKFQDFIYRPLISIKRETISIFVSQLDLSIIYDQSNNDLNITRNFIRHIILPLLKKINPQVEQNLYKFSQIANYYLTYSGDIVISAINFEIFKA